MTEREPDRLWSGIEIPKVMAGVLAAVSAAFLGSFLGVAGTLAGAALASVIGSVGTEIYHRSLKKGGEKLQNTFVTAPAAVGTPLVAAAADQRPSETSPADADPRSDAELTAVAAEATSAGATSADLAAAGTSADASSIGSGPAGVSADDTAGRTITDRNGTDRGAAGSSDRKIRWGRVILVAGSFFVLAVGALTAFELISGTTVPAAVGAKADSKCTVCSIGGTKAKTPATHTTAPSRTPSAEPSSPEPSPSETAPSATPSVTASPTGTTSDPATDAPSEPATTASGGGGTSTGATTPATQAPAQDQNINPPAAPNAELRSPDEGSK